MTLSELVAECKVRVAEQSPDFFNDDNWKLWLNEAQQVIVRQTRVLQRTKRTNTIPGVDSYRMDDDFWVVRLVKLDNQVIYPESIDQMELKQPAFGLPCRYSIWGNALYLTPTPTASLPLFVRYYAWPNKMEAEVDEPELPEAFHGLLPTYAAYRACQIDGRLQEADMLYAEFLRGVDETMRAMSEPQDQQTVVSDVLGYLSVDDWLDY